MRARPRRRRGRLGPFLFCVGCFSVLGAMFGAGIFVERYRIGGRSPAAVASTRAGGGEPRGQETSAPGRQSARPDATPSVESRPGARGATPSVESPPVLTFYEELTAPLPDAPSAASRRAADSAPTSPGGAAAGAAAPAERDRTGGGFAVQVGAFKDRAPAEALREALVLDGNEAYIVERDAAQGARYRVRIGSFSTRDAARAAAARLASERGVAVYVTAR